MPNRLSKTANILIVMADQLSALALRCHGNTVARTPNLDRLAETGVVFDAAYSSSPLCAPARYAFMSGQNIARCGGYDNSAHLPATVPTFAHYLRLAGYRTVLSGKMHFVGADQLHGFEERLTTDIYPADFAWVPDWENPHARIDKWYHNMSSVKQAGVAAVTNQLAYDDEVGACALRAIYDHARGTDDRPLCLVAGFIHPHDPYATRQQYWDWYDGVDIPPPSVARPAAPDAHSLRLEKAIAVDAVRLSAEEIANARRAYFGNISYLDAWLGRLLGALEECGMADDTTVIFTSDHGDMLGERGLWYKMSFLEWSNRIPLLVARPSRAAWAGRRVAQPVAQVDVLPTLLHLAAENSGRPALQPVDAVDGRSLLPLCDGADDDPAGVAVSEYLAEATSEPMLMLRRGAHKFIACAGDPDLLYDLDADPNELHNLAGDEKYADTVQAFREEAAAHWDPAQVKRDVIASQRRRRVLFDALATGRRHSWDYNPPRDAGEEYTRGHHELTDFDIRSRYPRPRKFTPRAG